MLPCRRISELCRTKNWTPYFKSSKLFLKSALNRATTSLDFKKGNGHWSPITLRSKLTKSSVICLLLLSYLVPFCMIAYPDYWTKHLIWKIITYMGQYTKHWTKKPRHTLICPHGWISILVQLAPARYSYSVLSKTTPQVASTSNSYLVGKDVDEHIGIVSKSSK